MDHCFARRSKSYFGRSAYTFQDDSSHPQESEPLRHFNYWKLTIWLPSRPEVDAACHARCHTPTHPNGRPLKIGLGEMREMGLRGVLVCCRNTLG